MFDESGPRPDTDPVHVEGTGKISHDTPVSDPQVRKKSAAGEREENDAAVQKIAKLIEEEGSGKDRQNILQKAMRAAETTNGADVLSTARQILRQPDRGIFDAGMQGPPSVDADALGKTMLKAGIMISHSENELVELFSRGSRVESRVMQSVIRQIAQPAFILGSWVRATIEKHAGTYRSSLSAEETRFCNALDVQLQENMQPAERTAYEHCDANMKRTLDAQPVTAPLSPQERAAGTRDQGHLGQWLFTRVADDLGLYSRIEYQSRVNTLMPVTLRFEMPENVAQTKPALHIRARAGMNTEAFVQSLQKSFGPARLVRAGTDWKINEVEIEDVRKLDTIVRTWRPGTPNQPRAA